MKKKLLIFTGIILLAIILYVGVNLLDQSLNPNVFKLAHLPATSFEKNNGFYLLWGLSQPKGVEVSGEKFMAPFKTLFQPDTGTEMNVQRFNEDNYRSPFQKTDEAIATIQFPTGVMEDWFAVLGQQQAALDQTERTCAFLLKRYRALLHSQYISDFSLPLPSIPTPPLGSFLKTIKLYTGVSIKKAMAGLWEEAAADLITQINYGKRLNSTARELFIHLIANATISISLEGLISLLNQPTCPGTVYSHVVAGLKPLTYEEYGCRSTFIFQFLCFSATIDQIGNHKNNYFFRFSFQKNTTKNYAYELYAKAIAYDTQEPYLWEKNPEQWLKEYIDSKKKSALWFLPNRYGKGLLVMMAPALHHVIFASWHLRMRYEMTRILADLHLHYRPDRNIPDILKELDSTKTLDPGSGQPYKWNEIKQVLLSVGLNGQENVGPVSAGKYEMDVMVPVVLKKNKP